MSLLPDKIRHALRSPSRNTGAGGASAALDFTHPRDNHYAFAKMWSTLADKPILSSFHGIMFANMSGRKTMPLFGYTGTGLFQSRMEDNGDVRLRGKETGFFTDLASGKILRTWENPFTGETVEVFNFLNDRVRRVLTPEMPRIDFGGDGDESTLMNEGTQERIFYSVLAALFKLASIKLLVIGWYLLRVRSKIACASSAS